MNKFFFRLLLSGIIFQSLCPTQSSHAHIQHRDYLVDDHPLVAQNNKSQMSEALNLFKRGSYSDSISAFGRIISNSKISRDQKNKAFIGRAQAFIVIGQPALALSDLNNTNYKEHEIEKLGEKYLIQGATYIQLKKYKVAVVYLNKAIRLIPMYASAYANRAVAFQSLNDLDAASKDLRKSLELDPTPSTIYNLAVLEKTKKNYSRCYTLLSRLEQSQVANADIFLQKGICAELIGNDAQALKDFLKAATIDNSNPFILEKIGLAVVKAGDKRTAVKYFERASEIYLSIGKIDKYMEVEAQLQIIMK